MCVCMYVFKCERLYAVGWVKIERYIARYMDRYTDRY